MQTMNLKGKIREIPDFPKPGINFKDICPLIEDPQSFKQAIDQLYGHYQDQEIDKVVGIDARGFIFAATLAYKLGTGLVIVRKKDKLPFKTAQESYDLEYGRNTLEIHKDSITRGEKVLIVDDVLATGGTALAVCNLVEKVGGEIVGVAFLITLDFLDGREKLKKYKIFNLIDYK